MKKWLWMFLICLFVTNKAKQTNITEMISSLKKNPHVHMKIHPKIFNPSESERKIEGVNLKELAASIGIVLQDISNRELGVPVMQNILDALEFQTVHDEICKKLKLITDKINQKFMNVFKLLNSTKAMIVDNFHELKNDHQLISTIYPLITWNVPKAAAAQFSSNKSDYLQYISLQSNFNKIDKNLSQVFAEHIESVSQVYSRIKEITFLASSDTKSSIEVNCSNCFAFDDAQIWKEYVTRLPIKDIHLLIMIDHGSDISTNQLHLAKIMAKNLLEMLSSDDYISVMAVSDQITTTLRINECSSASGQVLATPTNKELIFSFINALVPSKNVTNINLGFKEAMIKLEQMEKDTLNKHVGVLLIFISPASTAVNEAESRVVLETILNSRKLSIPTYINTLLIINDILVGVPEKEIFMNDLASLNSNKYNITNQQPLIKSGRMEKVGSIINLGLIATRYFSLMTSSDLKDGIKVSIPVLQVGTNCKESVVRITTKCSNYGLLSINLYLNNLIEDFLFAGFNPKYAYAFLIDMQGITIMHKYLNEPSGCVCAKQNIHINLLEQKFDFIYVKNAVKNHNQLNFTTKSQENQMKVYVCNEIAETFIGCVVELEHRLHSVKRLLPVRLPQDADVIHHRLDLLPTSKTLCRHLKQITSFDFGVVYLSASCFTSPFSQMRDPEIVTPQLIEHYMAYLKDHTGLITNPGFKPETRNDALSLLHMMSYLKARHLSGSLRPYSLRRYIASAGGVLQVYPGTNIQAGLEPMTRVWYERAINHPGRVVLSQPYLDSGGGGYIATLSHTVYEGKKDSMHNTKDNVYAVMGIDLTLGYFYKLLLQKIPFCKTREFKCFLMDENGYLIAHPSLMEPMGREPLQLVHIVNKESIIASDILNQKDFVKKMLCNNFLRSTIERFYKFNTSYVGTIQNMIMIHGQYCSTYQLTPIPGTNLFLGVVNSSCENSATFCPCSMVDRLCFNCNRMEQTECECPCECPMNAFKTESCSNPRNTDPQNESFAICPPMMIEEDHFNSNLSTFYSKLSDIKSCTNFHCELYTTEDSCMGIVGCEWCQIDLDGETPIETPFCTSLTNCFNGVFGSITPYGDTNTGAAITSGDLIASTYSAIGPIIGSLLILFLLLSLIIYFYRQHCRSISADVVFLEGDGDLGGLSTLRSNQLELDEINNERDGYRDQLMVYNIESISPYHISTGYRRPQTTHDSDHGYSTMTPHDDSEHLSVAIVEEPLLHPNHMNLDEIGSTKNSISVHYSGILRTQQPQVTSLKTTHKNSILVPVTVHCDMQL